MVRAPSIPAGALCGALENPALASTMTLYLEDQDFNACAASFSIGSFSSLEKYESMWGPVLRGIVPLLLSAYGFSFFWTAAAGTYLILRRDVDHAEFDLIDMGDQETTPLPELPKKESSVASSDQSAASSDQDTHV